MPLSCFSLTLLALFFLDTYCRRSNFFLARPYSAVPLSCFLLTLLCYYFSAHYLCTLIFFHAHLSYPTLLQIFSCALVPCCKFFRAHLPCCALFFYALTLLRFLCTYPAQDDLSADDKKAGIFSILDCKNC